MATAAIEFNDGTPIEVTQDAIDHIENTLLQMNETLQTASGAPVLRDHITLQAGAIACKPTRYFL